MQQHTLALRLTDQAIHAIQEEDTGTQSRQTCQRRDQQALAHDLRDDVPRLGTQCPAHANLFRTLLDRHHHDVAHTNDARQQRAYTHNPHQDVNTHKKVVEGLELRRQVDCGNGLRIGRGDIVLLLDDTFDLVDHRQHLYVRLSRHTEEMDDVSLVQRLLHGAERQEHALLRTTTDVHARSSLLHHAHHLVVDAIHPDIFTAGILILEEHLLHLDTDHTDLTMLPLVHLVEQPPIVQPLRLDLEIVRMDALHVETATHHAIDNVLVRTVSPDDRGDRRQLLHLPPDALHIAVAHVPLPSFVESLIRFAGAIRKEEGRIGRKAIDTLHDAILHASTGT